MPDPTSAWTDREIITLVVSTGVISAMANAVLGTAKELFFGADKRRRDAAYLALRLVVTLDTYVHECAEQLFTNDHAFHPEGEEFPLIDGTLPKLAELPADGDAWRAFNSALAAQCLAFPNRIAEGQAQIREISEYDEQQAFEEVEEQLLQLALGAATITGKISYRYKIERPEPLWDRVGSLERRLELVQRQARERRARVSDQLLAENGSEARR